MSDYLKPREAAAFCGIGLPSLWRAVAAGRLPAPVYPLPRSPRWSAAELRAALEAHRALPREQMARRRKSAPSPK